MPSFARGSATPTYWGLIHRWLLLNGVILTMKKLHLSSSATKATDKDIRDFRGIRSEQEKKAGRTLAVVPGLRKTLVRINRALGSPWRIPLAARAAVLGIHRSGTAVSAQHGIGMTTQFLEIFAEVMRSGISVLKNMDLYQLYLPARWRSRRQQFADDSQLISAQQCLIERKRPRRLPARAIQTSVRGLLQRSKAAKRSFACRVRRWTPRGNAGRSTSHRSGFGYIGTAWI